MIVGCKSEPRVPLPEKIDSTLWSKVFSNVPISAKSGLVSQTVQSGKGFSIGSVRGYFWILDSCQQQRT